MITDDKFSISKLTCLS